MQSLIEKINASEPDVYGESAKQIFDALMLDVRFVWFSDILSTGINTFSLYQLIDKFIYGMAGVAQGNSFVPTSQPMHILQFSTDLTEDHANDIVKTTALVYANGVVIYITGRKDLFLLLIDRDTCDSHQIEYSQVDTSHDPE